MFKLAKLKILRFSVVPIWFLYLTAGSLASYVLSFAFESPTKGTVFILAFHTIIPMITFIAVMIGLNLAKFVLKLEVDRLVDIVMVSFKIVLKFVFI